MAEALAAQDHLYTLVERGNGEPRPRVVGSIIDYRLAHDAAGRCRRARWPIPAVAIVSLTITEAGYGDGRRRHVSAPTTFDVIADGPRATARRRATPPLTIVSCDNLPATVTPPGGPRSPPPAGGARRSPTGPSVTARSRTRWSIASRRRPRTPTAPGSSTRSASMDRWPVVAEPFRQWVIEDEFANGRPRVGGRRRAVHRSRPRLGAVQAAPAQRRPLEHGLPRRARRHHVRRRGHGAPRGAPLPPRTSCIDEAVPSLAEIPDHPRRDYVASVLERFANTGVRDQIARLCIDGSGEVPDVPAPDGRVPARHTTDRSPAARWRWPAGPGTWPASRRTEQAFDAGRRHGAPVRPQGHRRPGPLPRLRGGVPAGGRATTTGSAPPSPPRGSASATSARSPRWGTETTLAVSVRTVQHR